MKAIPTLLDITSASIIEEPEAVDKVISDMLKHVWYLDAKLVTLALLDDEVSIMKRERL